MDLPWKKCFSTDHAVDHLKSLRNAIARQGATKWHSTEIVIINKSLVRKVISYDSIRIVVSLRNDSDVISFHISIFSNQEWISSDTPQFFLSNTAKYTDRNNTTCSPIWSIYEYQYNFLWFEFLLRGSERIDLLTVENQKWAGIDLYSRGRIIQQEPTDI